MLSIRLHHLPSGALGGVDVAPGDLAQPLGVVLGVERPISQAGAARAASPTIGGVAALAQ
jgi:hypothetical protein